MGDEEKVDSEQVDGKRRRRRRRRRHSNQGGSGPSGKKGTGDWGDDVLLPEESMQPTITERKGRKGRRSVEFSGPPVSIPATGRNAHKKRTTRPRRSPPKSSGGRRRTLNRNEVKKLASYLHEMPESLVANLYRGLGGQPSRVASHDRMIQLAVRAIAQGSRLEKMLKQLSDRGRKVIAALIQVGGIAQCDEFLHEVSLSLGGSEREWQKTLVSLANSGVIVASAEKEGAFFYIVPEPLMDGLLAGLADELTLPNFSHSEMRVVESKPFCPPLDFSVTTLATYIDYASPRLTQRQEIYRTDQESMDAFFGQIWDKDSELFSFHLDFLMMHGMVELRGEYLSLNNAVMDEWLNLEPEDQRDLLFRALNTRFPMAEWVLWAIHAAEKEKMQESKSTDEPVWVAERPLVTFYRRWQRGVNWRERYERDAFGSVRTGERQSYSFAPLVDCGLLELGQWGQEKFYRLSPRGRRLLEPSEDDGFRQFYLTPAFEIMAPAGLAPVLLYRTGELAELVGCDRANTYKITEMSINRALERGWRRDDILQFLRDNSQIGLPDNVEATLKGWIGHQGDVEFHQLTLMTVHRSQIRRLEGNRKIKPYLLHRFAPGMYAVDPKRRDEIEETLRQSHFSPGKELRSYPADPEQAESRKNLHRYVSEAREATVEPTSRSHGVVNPEDMLTVPGVRQAELPGSKEALPNLVVNPEDAKTLLEGAIQSGQDVELVYHAKTGERLSLFVTPERLALKDDAPVLVGLDREENAMRTFLLDRIERLGLFEEIT